MTLSSDTRGPFRKASWQVLRKHPRGIEALITLAVLDVHFQSMLPYCYEQLRLQFALRTPSWPLPRVQRRASIARTRCGDPLAYARPSPFACGPASE